MPVAVPTWASRLSVRLSMAVRTNRQMRELLGGDPEFHEPNTEPVPESLIDELKEGFKEVDGRVVPLFFSGDIHLL